MKLSVAICTYNGAKYIEEQLLSILQQRLPINEIVVCDDGSIDNTFSIIKGIANSYSSVEWKIKQNVSNLGVIKNFEQAINLCSGDIIFLSDQDDIWRKDKTSLIMEYFNKNNRIDVVFSDANIVGEDGSLLTNHSLLEAWSLIPNISLWNEGLKLEIINYSNKVTGATMAFRKSALKSFLPFEDNKRCLHDYQIAIYGCAYNSLGIIQDTLISYRQHIDNVMGISKENWVYTGKASSVLLPTIIEPLPLKASFFKYNTPRVNFYLNRLKNYGTLIGKIFLLFMLPKYIKYYGAYWKIFFLSDFLYGINNSIRDKFINIVVKMR
jgi:glycosyltransferase involved in cell wall biosynthesis